MASLGKMYYSLGSFCVFVLLIEITKAQTYDMDNSINCNQIISNTVYGDWDTDYVRARSTLSSTSDFPTCEITFYSSSTSYPRIKVQSLSSYWSWPCFSYSNSDASLRIHDGITSYSSQLGSLNCYSSSTKSYVSSGSYLTFKLTRSRNSNFNFKFSVTATAENGILTVGAISGIVVSVVISTVVAIAVIILCRRRRRILQHTTIVQGAPVAGGVNVVTSSTSQQQQQMGTGYVAQPVYPQQYPQGYPGNAVPQAAAHQGYPTHPPAYTHDTAKLITN